MANNLSPALPEPLPPRHRKRDGNTDDEHEKRLDQVPKTQAVPGVVLALGPDRMQERPLQGRVDKMGVDMCAFPDQEKHRHTAKNVEGKKPIRHGSRACC
jgi:hypothetical protein